MRLLLPVFAFVACSWGVHDADRRQCPDDKVGCGRACIDPASPCRLGVTTMKSRLEGRGPDVVALVVKTVQTHSPADVAGLRPGDAITRIGDYAATSDLLESIQSEPKFVLYFLRQGFSLKTEVHLK